MVFAYHEIGVRCLRALLAHQVQVSLVVTHTDAPGEQIWFDSVAKHAAWHDIPVITPEDPNGPDCLARVRAARPTGTIDGFLHSLDGKVKLRKPLSIEDINRIVAAGWAGDLDQA